MAMANVEVKCDHCGEWYTVRKECHKRSEADSFEEYIKAQDTHTCPKCYAAQKREEGLNERGNLEQKFEVPEIDGTEKQIAYAKDIRYRYLKSVGDLKKPKNINVVKEFFKSKTSARWWIDNRFKTIHDFSQEIQAILDNQPRGVGDNDAQGQS